MSMDFLMWVGIRIGIVARHRHREGSIMTDFFMDYWMMLFGRRNIHRWILFGKGM